MPLDIEGTGWMPSPPLVPDEALIDLDHLSRMTCGERGLERDVLTMFALQVNEVVALLRTAPANAAELAHTLKGSARSVGAFGLADAMEAYEADLHRGVAMTASLDLVRAEARRTRTAIAAILARS